MENTASQNVSPVTAISVKGVVFDEQGFLRNPRDWNMDVAREIARLDGVGELGADHWAILFHFREHYLQHGTPPLSGHVCRTYHLGKGAVQRLFGSCRRAWRIAGLPDPGEEVRAYMN
jgi:tRNA 2-thiouridine synthesizing protein E